MSTYRHHALWLSSLHGLINEDGMELEACQSGISSTHTCTADHISGFKQCLKI